MTQIARGITTLVKPVTPTPEDATATSSVHLSSKLGTVSQSTPEIGRELLDRLNATVLVGWVWIA